MEPSTASSDASTSETSETEQSTVEEDEEEDEVWVLKLAPDTLERFFCSATPHPRFLLPPILLLLENIQR